MLVPLQQMQFTLRSCVQPSQTLECFARWLLSQRRNQDVLVKYAYLWFAAEWAQLWVSIELTGSLLSESVVCDFFVSDCLDMINT